MRAKIFSEESGGVTNPLNSGLQRTFVWTLMLLMIVCCARILLFTDFCPHVDALFLPDERDGDGLPPWVGFHIDRWKGNTSKRAQV